MIDAQDQIEFDYLLAEKINIPNHILFSLTGESGYGIVESIREQYDKYGTLSKKQRSVLAGYLAHKEIK